MSRAASTVALVVAAGRGTRLGGVPKQWRMLGGMTVLERTLGAFAAHPGIAHVAAVLHPDDTGRLTGQEVIAGGGSRSASVRAGLEALAGRFDRVLIHDGARPLVPAHVITAVLEALDRGPGAAPALAVTDALWSGAAAVEGMQDRAGLWWAQTPQGFHLGAILAAHRAHPGDAADDVAVARAAGLDVAIVPGDEDNIKITAPGDLERAARILGGRMDVRLGNGFDVHRFGPGDHVTLCGVRVPFGRGLQGHSDADVGLHALCDAIYGALGEGDIGRHFPPSEARWKGADSAVFLEHAAALAGARGFAIANLDATLICEAPKIGPHADAMRARVAEIASLDLARISVKATTSEQLGFTGRGEGIACIATAALIAR